MCTIPLPEHSSIKYCSVQCCRSCPLQTRQAFFLQAQNLQLTVLKAEEKAKTPILLVFCLREREISEDSSVKVMTWGIATVTIGLIFSSSLIMSYNPSIQTWSRKWAGGTTVLLGNSMNRYRNKALCKRPCVGNDGHGEIV